MKLITASSSALARKCLRPFADDAVWDQGRSSWSMRIGSAVHEAMETWLLGGDVRVELLAERWELTARQCEIVETSWARLKAYLLDEWKDTLDVIQPEHRFCLDHSLQNAKDLGHGETARDYSGAEGQLVAGTVDAVAIVNGKARLLELKVGSGHQDHPSRNAQLLTQSLMVTKAYGLQSIEAVLVQVNEKGIDVRKADLDVFDLLEVEEAIGEWAKGDTTPRPGDHCARCRVVGCEVRQQKETRAA